MPVSIPLSKITKVDLRDCWQNEATDFTPWLAEEDNLDLLSEVISLDLEVTSREEKIDGGRADLLCVEPGYYQVSVEVFGALHLAYFRPPSEEL